MNSKTCLRLCQVFLLLGQVCCGASLMNFTVQLLHSSAPELPFVFRSCFYVFVDAFILFVHGFSYFIFVLLTCTETLHDDCFKLFVKQFIFISVLLVSRDLFVEATSFIKDPTSTYQASYGLWMPHRPLLVLGVYLSW